MPSTPVTRHEVDTQSDDEAARAAIDTALPRVTKADGTLNTSGGGAVRRNGNGGKNHDDDDDNANVASDDSSDSSSNADHPLATALKAAEN